MSMNVPPKENQSAPVTPTQPEVTPPTEQQITGTPSEQPTPTETPQENQVIEEVAQGLADEEITAEDIMVAVLSDSLGLSPNGARSLFALLMRDLIDETPAEEPTTEQPPME